MAAAAIIFGVVTWYGAGFYDQPLYCGGIYDRAEAAVQPWIAVDSSLLESGWQCLDEVILLFDDGRRVQARIRDTGPLFRYYIEDWGPDVPIVADIADHSGEEGKKSALCGVLNVSHLMRLWAREEHGPLWEFLYYSEQW